MYWKLCHADLKEAIRRGDAAPETLRGDARGWWMEDVFFFQIGFLFLFEWEGFFGHVFLFVQNFQNHFLEAYTSRHKI